MKHYLGTGTIGPQTYPEISLSEYERGKAAAEGVRTLLSAEEKFQMALENYFEYENELLTLGLRFMVWHKVSESVMRAAKATTNRRLGNYLAMARMYLDHTDRELKSIYGKSSTESINFNSARNEQYDTLFGYRVMEAIRNSMQHNCLPIQSFTFPSKWEQGDNTTFLRHGAEASLSIKALARDGKLKPAIQAELSALKSDRLDATGLLRQHVEGLGAAHAQFRLCTKERLDEWEKCVRSLKDKIEEANGEVIPIFEAYKMNETEEIDVEKFVFNSRSLSTLATMREVSCATSLSRWYVSNRLTES